MIVRVILVSIVFVLGFASGIFAQTYRTAVSSVPGDINNDGVVGLDDFTIVVKNWGVKRDGE